MTTTMHIAWAVINFVAGIALFLAVGVMVWILAHATDAIENVLEKVRRKTRRKP